MSSNCRDRAGAARVLAHSMFGARQWRASPPFAALAWTFAAQRLPVVVAEQLIIMETIFGTTFGLMVHHRWPTVAETSGMGLCSGGILLIISSSRRVPCAVSTSAVASEFSSSRSGNRCRGMTKAFAMSVGTMGEPEPQDGETVDFGQSGFLLLWACRPTTPNSAGRRA
jgi:hypothetical protein